MTTPPWPERLYRVVRTNPPAEEDFLSNWELRERAIAAERAPRPIPNTSEELHMWSGISTYTNAARARKQAQRYSWLGGFITPLRIRPGQDIRVEQTTHRRDHYTLWGTPAVLLATVELEQIEAV